MMQKPISGGKPAVLRPGIIPAKIVILTLDNHMASAVSRAGELLKDDLPGVELKLHAVAAMGERVLDLEACRADIETADFIIANMLFMEDHIQKVKPWLDARLETCDCMVGCLSAAEIVRMTKLGDFSMSKPTGGALGLLKRLRGKAGKDGSAGQRQMKLLRSIPRLLRYIPGKAQDVRAYFLVLQYMLAGSDENIANMARFLISRYATGEREPLRKDARPAEPVDYPDVGLYHPALPNRVTSDAAAYRRATGEKGTAGTVGLLVMRSYLLAENTAHYDGVIRELESRGLNVIAAYASGLDARPAIEEFFKSDGRPIIDCLISLTGFSLVGGPAYNDAAAAETVLASMDIPYLSAFATEFQSIQAWGDSQQGLTPVETTIMMALPEIDGATGPLLYGGRAEPRRACTGCARNCVFEGKNTGLDMVSCPERAEMLAARAARHVTLRRKPRKDRKLATVLFNFPPNGGATGTAAYLDVFASLHNTLKVLAEEGYSVDIPETPEALRNMVLGGNSDQFGTAANVAARIHADDHVRGEKWLPAIEAQWGPAPGKIQSDGTNILVLGHHFGNVFVGIQPAFGYEGDPMRLLFEHGFAPTHAFSAFYNYLKDDFRADAVLHFGTHGALEFMPGKQAGVSGDCWPDRLIGDLPNIYLYAANNPSEGTLARRRSAATLVSYLTPPVGHAGLYRGLLDLKDGLDRWRMLEPAATEERARLQDVIFEQAVRLDLLPEDSVWPTDAGSQIFDLTRQVAEFEATLIPHGLHVVGQAMADDARRDMLSTVNDAMGEAKLASDDLVDILAGNVIDLGKASEERIHAMQTLTQLNADLQRDHELPALVRALDGRYIRPVSGGDVVRSPAIVPTGRNLHGFDPFRMPSAFAVADGRMQADLVIARHVKDHGAMPRRIAMVLWGTDNLKSEGGPIAQALWLIGAEPRFDSFGRLAGAKLLPLETVGRARVDVVITLSGIFRDLLPLQTRLLAEACLLAAQADEPEDMNPIRAHALSYARENNCDMETAALRVFSNASGTYGANVNQLIDAGTWQEENELADVYTKRKSFAYGVSGKPVAQEALLGSILAEVDACYQNIESIELAITSVDHYFDTLGGISSAIKRAGGVDVTVYVGDQTTGAGKVRTLSEQVALETRTRTLNPKWYEAMLDHGYEGVRQIENQVSNTLGWSATTGQVDPWVYKRMTETFMLDETMRRRLSELNPKASAKLVNRLIEASDRKYWTPDAETWKALCAAGDEMEDRAEGIGVEAAA